MICDTCDRDKPDCLEDDSGDMVCGSCRENAAEAAYDRYQERCMEDPPMTMDEIHRAAWEEKRRLK